MSIWGADPQQYGVAKLSSKVSAYVFLKDKKVVVFFFLKLYLYFPYGNERFPQCILSKKAVTMSFLCFLYRPHLQNPCRLSDVPCVLLALSLGFMC